MYKVSCSISNWKGLGNTIRKQGYPRCWRFNICQSRQYWGPLSHTMWNNFPNSQFREAVFAEECLLSLNQIFQTTVLQCSWMHDGHSVSVYEGLIFSLLHLQLPVLHKRPHLKGLPMAGQEVLLGMDGRNGALKPYFVCRWFLHDILACGHNIYARENRKPSKICIADFAWDHKVE